MPYRIAGIDIHKKMLAVVVSDVGAEGIVVQERRKFLSTPQQLGCLAEWLVEWEVDEVVMESTAQYWQPVWGALEETWQPSRQGHPGRGTHAGKIHLAQAQSNRGRRGRKDDFPDAERLIRRLVAGELILSFVPDPPQRLWRVVTRRRNQLGRSKVQLQNQLESLLEQAHIKLSSIVSDLLGVSERRMLQAIAEGERDPAVLAAMADRNLKATPEQLQDALSACRTLDPTFREFNPHDVGAPAAIGKANRRSGKESIRTDEGGSGRGRAIGQSSRHGGQFRVANHRRSGSSRGFVSNPS